MANVGSAAGGNKAVVAAFHPHTVVGGVERSRGDALADGIARVVLEFRVLHVYGEGYGRAVEEYFKTIRVCPVASEAEDGTAVDVELPSREEPDAVEAGARSVD